MDYNTLVLYLENLLQDQQPSANFTQILPAAIQDAEQRIYRECDFLYTRTVNATLTFVPGNRCLCLPSSIILIQGVAAVTPAITPPYAGTRNQLEIVSLDFIDYAWPTSSQSQSLPEYVAMMDSKTIVVAPTPDKAYTAEITGIFRPDPLSASNPNTYISTTYPDLMVAATMVFMTGYQRDFGSQADDPKMAMSWEQLYQDRKKSVYEEEQRRKGASSGWSQFQQTPLAMPARS